MHKCTHAYALSTHLPFGLGGLRQPAEAAVVLKVRQLAHVHLDLFEFGAVLLCRKRAKSRKVSSKLFINMQ